MNITILFLEGVLIPLPHFMEIDCLSRLDTVTRNYIQPLKLQAMASLKRVMLGECSLHGIGLHTREFPQLQKIVMARCQIFVVCVS